MKANNLCIDDDEKMTGKNFHKDGFGGEPPKNGYFFAGSRISCPDQRVLTNNEPGISIKRI